MCDERATDGEEVVKEERKEIPKEGEGMRRRRCAGEAVDGEGRDGCGRGRAWREQ